MTDLPFDPTPLPLRDSPLGDLPPFSEALPTVPAAFDPNTPPPPLTGLPVERVAGGWGDYPAADEYPPPPSADVTPLTVSAVPLIGAIPFGGRVMAAGRIDLAAGRAETIGDQYPTRPVVTTIILAPTVGTVDVVTDPDGLARGFELGVPTAGSFWTLPTSFVTLKNNSGAPAQCQFIVIGYYAE